MKKHLRLLMLLAALLLPWASQAQSLEDYQFSTGNDADRWITITDGTVILESPGTGSGNTLGTDSKASEVVPIGFSFPFGEEIYTQFSVNTDGNLRLGATVTGTSNYTNPFNSSNCGLNAPKINFLGCDGKMKPTGYVKKKVTTNADGDTLLVVEFNTSFYNSYNVNTSADMLWQVHLYKNGNIEIVYPSTVPATTPSVTRQVGMSEDGGNLWLVSQLHVATHYTAGQSATIPGNNWPDANRYYRFVRPVISCPKPGALTVDDITSSSATINWIAGGEEEEWLVSVNGGAYTTVYEDSMVLDNLDANTQYTVVVRALCGEGDTSLPATETFRTRCESIATLPYSYGFEDAASSGAAYPINPCWNKGTNNTTTAYPYPYSQQKHSGLYSLYMHSSSTYYSYAAMPAFVEDISNIYLSFWAMKTSAAYGHVAVGVMSDPDNIATFDTVALLQVEDLNTWEMFDVDFSAYEGNGGYIAFLAYQGAATMNYVYIDDITVIQTPTCFRPTDMTVLTYDDATATIRWSSSEGATDYTVLYGTTDFDPATATNVLSESTTDTVITLTGLNAQTTYWVKVAANCSDNSSSLWSQVSFKTMCAAVASLPYTYGFEDASGTTSTSTINACWTKGTNYSTAYPYPYGTYKHTGTKSLYFYSATTNYSYAAMPAFEAPLNTLMLSFWAYKTSAAYGRLYVGVMSNPADISTFDTVAMLQVQTASSWEEFSIPLVNYSGNGRYIAFLAPQGASNYVYLDDITVGLAPSCLLPDNLHVEALSANAATLAWIPAGTNTGYEILYDTVNFTPDTANNALQVIVGGGSTNTELTYLEPNTTYYVKLRTLCADDTTEWTALSFTTSCEAVSVLPWTFEPDSMGTTTSATSIPCFDHLGGGYVNIATRTGFTGNTVRFYPNSSALPNILVLPEFEAPLSSLYLLFKTAPEGASSGSFDVGYITNAVDSTTFVSVGNYPVSFFNGSGSVVPAILAATFADAPAGARMAFRHNVNSTTYYWLLDEVTVMEMPSCFPPDSVVVDNVSSNGAMLGFYGNSGSYVVTLYADGGETGDTIEASGSSLELEDLNPGTYYNGIVYGLCGNDTSAIGVAFSFVTDCEVLELPVTLDAEGVWLGTASAPERPCYDFKNYGSTTYNWRYSTTASNVHDGAKTFYYYGSTGTTYEVDDWMMLPQMNFTGADAISMWVKTGSSTTSATYHGHIAFYATVEDSSASSDTADYYRLVVTGDSVTNNRVDFYGNTWQFLTVNLPADLEGEHRLALVVEEQTYTFYVDDITVYTRSACPTVQDVEVIAYDSTSATISWTDTNNIGSYVVTYWPEGAELTEDDTLTVTVSDTVAFLENLQPDSVYFVSVQADCGDLSMATYPVSFRTNCLAIPEADLPYIEDFEAYASGSANPISTCWDKGVEGSTTQYPYPYSTAASTGSRGLYFYSTASIMSYAVMPMFATGINDLMVEFSLKRPSSSTYKTILLVGAIADPNDLTTFDVIDSVDLSAEPTSSVHRLRVSLEGYYGEGTRIAFVAPKLSTGTNYAYLDSVVVKRLPDCRWPMNLAVEAVGSSSVDLTWEGSGYNYYVEASTSMEFTNVAASVATTETSATVGNLADFTQYFFRVRTVCDGDSSEWSQIVSANTELDCGEGFVEAKDTIEYGTSTSSSYVINGSSSYTNTANWHIYTVSELLDLGLMDTLNYIRGISIETGTVGTSPIPFRVYMGTTGLDEWHSATSATSTTGLNDTLPISSMQLVYDGSMLFEANSWNEIAFNTPFLYHGDSNLVVAFVRDASITGTTNFKYGTVQTYATAYKYTSGSSTYAYRTKSAANMAFIACNHVPSCPRPADVTVGNVDTGSFELSWTGSSEGYTVVVSLSPIDPASAVASDSVSVLTSDTSHITVTGLAPQTTYYYYLRSDCGDEHSTWTIEGSLQTLCTPKAIPFFEDFNGMVALANGDGTAMEGGAPPCWDVFSSHSGSYIALYSSSTYRYGSSGYSLKFRSGAADVSNYLVLPIFSQPINALELSFQTRPEGTSASAGVFDVGYMTDPSDETSFVVVQHYSYSDFSGAYQLKTVSFENAPDSARMVLRHTPTSASYYWFVDEIDVHILPTCPRLDSVTVSQITQNSAVVRWVNPRNNNASYEVEYGQPGFVHGQGTSLIVNTDSVVLTGLVNSSHYEVSVRALCSETDASLWSDAVSFNTECGQISLPYSMDWEYESTGSTGALPLCWQRFNNGGSTNYPYVSSSATSAHNGTKYAYFYFYNSSSYATDEAFISPAIDTANYPINNVEVSFWAKSSVAGKHIMVGVMSGSGDMATFTLIDTIALTTTYTEYFVNTASYSGNGDRIVFRSMAEGFTSTSTSYSINLDEVYIDVIPACARVYDLTVTDVTHNTAVLGWTDTVGCTSWVVEYSEAYVQNPTVNTVVATVNPFTLTGLNPTTTYTFRVAPICPNGDTSSFSREAASFVTSQVPATVPYTYDFEDAAEWQNWQTASNNTVNWYRGDIVPGNNSNVMYLSADGGATNSWRRNVVTNVAAYRDIDFGAAQNSFEVSFRYRGGGNPAAVNDGISVMVVDPAIDVVIPDTYLGTPWGSNVRWVHARYDTIWGVHTMSIDGISGVKRVVFYHFNNALNGEYLDIAPAIDDISIVPQACVRPYDLAASNFTSNGATLTWTGDDTAFYMVRIKDNSASAYRYVNVQGNSYTFTDLSANTTYTWSAMKICDTTEADPVTSSWATNATFTTLCSLTALPYSEDFESVEGTTYNTVGSLPGCWEAYTSGTDNKYFPHVTGSGSYWYPHSGTNCLTMTSGSGATQGNTKVVALPPFTAPVSTLNMTFWYRMESATNGTLTVGYVTDPTDLDGSFVLVKTVTSATTHTQDSVSFDVAQSNAVQIAFRWEHNSTFYSVGIDDIRVTTVAPPCDMPEDLAAVATHNSIALSWSGVADSFEVALVEGEWQEPDGGTVVTGNNYTFTDLTPSTAYSVGLRALCPMGMTSEWVLLSVTTDQQPCYVPTALAVSDIDYTSAVVAFTPGAEQNAWELHVTGPSLDRYDTLASATHTLTGLASATAYQVSVRALCGEQLASAWSDTVSFTTLTCEQVTGVTVSDITGTTARVSWNATGATSYTVDFGYQGTSQGQGTSITVSTNSVVLTGLDTETSYDVYVRATCAEGVTGLWSATTNFTTTGGSGPAPTYYTITVLANNNAWGTVSGGGSFLENTTTTIGATANDGYHFVSWQDGNTDNPRTITVTADMTYTATFADNVGIDEVSLDEVTLYPNPATSTVTVRAGGMEQVSVIDLNGRTVMSQRAADGTVTFDVSMLARGTYFVRIVGEQAAAVRKLVLK